MVCLLLEERWRMVLFSLCQASWHIQTTLLMEEKEWDPVIWHIWNISANVITYDSGVSNCQKLIHTQTAISNYDRSRIRTKKAPLAWLLWASFMEINLQPLFHPSCQDNVRSMFSFKKTDITTTAKGSRCFVKNPVHCASDQSCILWYSLHIKCMSAVMQLFTTYSLDTGG
jgi:hypothetical protein